MSRVRPVPVIGAGGHAKVVIQAIRAMGHAVARVFDDDPNLEGRSIGDAPVGCPVARIEAYPSLPTVIAIGNNQRRRFFAERFDLEWMTVVHPKAYVDSSTCLGHGVVVLPGAVLQLDSRVGDHVIVNTGATVDHDCAISAYVHLAPGVRLGGGVTIGEGTRLGIGAMAIPNMHIGAWTTIGAGAVVVNDIPDGVTAFGVPALVRSCTSAGLSLRVVGNGLNTARSTGTEASLISRASAPGGK